MTPSDVPLDALPDALLGPLVETATTVLRAFPPDDVPAGLRPLLSFDRRGFSSGAARRQLLKALSKDAVFRTGVATTFGMFPEVDALVDGLTVANAYGRAVEAADRDDLDWFVCALWALAPEVHEFALGCAVAVRADRSRARDRASDAEGLALRVEEAESARGRAERAQAEAIAKATKLAAELREERGGRRRRDEQASAREASAQRAADNVNAQLTEERARSEALRNRANTEAERAKRFETQLAQARVRIEQLSAASDHDDDSGELGALAQSAAQLASRLRAAEQRAAQRRRSGAGSERQHPSAGSRPSAPQRRAKPALPGGLVADSAQGAQAMLAAEGTLFIVDGYNVSNRGWPGATASEQREHLARALQQVQGRFGCDIVCCFDGDGTEGVRPLRRAGLRVLFSAAEQEADELVIETIVALSKRVPVVVASSDGWVREHAEAAGAVVISADTAVAVAQLAGRR